MAADLRRQPAALALALALCAAPATWAQETALLPREVVFGPPALLRPSVAPDAQHLAWLETTPNGGALVVRNLAGGAERRIEPERGVQHYLWAEDGRHLLYIPHPTPKGEAHLFAVDVTSGKVRDLTPFDEVLARHPVTSPRKPNHVLVELNRRDRRVLDVHEVDLTDDSLRLAAENPGGVIGWVADPDLRVRAAVLSDPRDGSKHLLTLPDDDPPWREIAAWPFHEEGGVVGFAPDGTSLFVETSLGADTSRLVRMDAATGDELEVVARDLRADVGRVLLDPTSGAVQAVSFEFLEPGWRILDDALRADFAALAKLRRGAVWVVSRDRSDSLWTVALQSARGPVEYLLWHRAEQRAETLFGNRPALEPYTLASREGRVIRARDGLPLPLYLTQPATGSEAPAPLVVAVHGGPWARDSYGWDPIAQWLASRGYVVLQLNYRGSSGFGRSFLSAGDKQWGPGAMQTDLADAVAWAVDNEIGDPKHVCVYGASFGGYAALSAAAFQPQRYTCAVALGGYSDVSRLVESVPEAFAPLRGRLLGRIGDVLGDEALNRRISPLYHTDRIKIPLLVAQGEKDPQVRVKDTERLVETLRAHELPVEWVVYRGEGHQLARAANRLDFYARTEAFLAKHLGGRSEPYAPSDQTTATLR
jgi:dipeptidyl aminopeptidase/acylaminoacyl peptidase